jgi:glycosyltransferase involved in cell wall biosynthesis
VALITNVIVPYRNPLYAELARCVDLLVVFSAERRSGGLPWKRARELPFRHVIVGGKTISLRRKDYYVTGRLLRLLRNERPHVVISAGYSFPTLYAAAYCSGSGASFIVASDGTRASERRLNPLQHLARSVLLRRVDACVASSAPAHERLVELGVPESRIFRSPLTSNLEPLWRVAARRAARQPECVTVLAIGRLVPEKGFDKLLLALSSSRGCGDRGSELRLILVGTGPEESRLRTLVDDLGLGNVEFRGFIDHSRLPSCFAEADIFALPSIYEPFGVVLIEAAASGLPLVASRYAGATCDFVRHGETGLVVDPLAPVELGRTLISLASSCEKRAELGRAAHLATRARSPREAANGIVAAIDAVLASRDLGRFSAP